MYLNRGYPYTAIVSFLEKRNGVQMHVRMLKTKLKKKLKPVRCFLSTFTLITCRSFIILNFIYARKASQIQVLECLPLFLSLSSFFIIMRTKNLYGKKNKSNGVGLLRMYVSTCVTNKLQMNPEHLQQFIPNLHN